MDNQLEQLIIELKEVYRQKADVETENLSLKKEIQKLKFQLQEEKSINSMLAKRNKALQCGG